MSDANSQSNDDHAIRQAISETLDSVSDSISDAGHKTSERAVDIAGLAAAIITSRSAAAVGVINQVFENVAAHANNTVEAIGDTTAWIIEHVEHLSLKDRSTGANYHRIRAVGDASDMLRERLDGIGLEDYDIQIEASVDSSTSGDDMLIIEIYKPAEDGEKPVIEEQALSSEMQS